MQAHYYCLQNASLKRQEFSDLYSIILFFKRYAHPQGEIFLLEIPDIKLKYDVELGTVRTSLHTTSKIKNFYSSQLLKVYVQPIQQALYSIAKLELLLQITKLEDKELTKFIRSKHFNDQEEFINLSLQHLDTTLHCVKNKSNQPLLFSFLKFFSKSERLSETHHAVCEALAEHGIDEIKCKKDVEKVMARIAHILDKKRSNVVTMR